MEFNPDKKDKKRSPGKKQGAAQGRRLFQVGEFGLIDMIARQVPAGKDVLIGIGDDTAMVSVGKMKVLLTTDMMAEGVHFTRDMGAEAIGHKALACNISDIAAMGGVPTFAVVSLGVPPGTALKFVQGLYRGMNRLARSMEVSIVGGDTIRTEKLIINVALMGETQRAVSRAGACPGDKIFVTGPLGRSFSSDKHLHFTPRLAEAQFLMKNNFVPTAMVDISDGLAADLGHILESSHAGAVLEESRIPHFRGATLKETLFDGEDFELLFTLKPAQARRLEQFSGKSPRFYPIGEIIPAKQRLFLERGAGRVEISTKGFTHF